MDHRIDALQLIKIMDEKLYHFLAQDNIDKPNNKDLHIICRHRWDYLMKYVKPLYEEIAYATECFAKELEIRKTQYEDGLISHKEYVISIANEAHFTLSIIGEMHE